jgi:dihydrolipoamide dehydrogenase
MILMNRRIIVIGGGPAGIEAARAAATAGARVTLVSNSKLGGRAGWHSLVPSKVWLTAADTYGLLAEARTLGLAYSGPMRPNPQAVLARIRAVTSRWNARQEATLATLGVEMQKGTAAFQSATSVIVTHHDSTSRLEADAIIVTSGSVPLFPADMRPDGKRVLAPRFASHLETLPPDIVVVGGGATGCEFAYLFNRLGVKVTWIVNQSGVLPSFHPDAGQFLAETMRRRGTEIAYGYATQISRSDSGVTVITADGARYSAAMAFLAIGRKADISKLNLSAVIDTPIANNALATSKFGRTAIPTIYAAGDVTGAPMLANRAMTQARVAGRHAAGADTLPFRPETVVHAIYSDPQVAQVGNMMDAESTRVRLPFAAVLKTHLIPEGESSTDGGFLELAYDKRNRALLGGVAVGPHAADVLAPVAMAIQMHATLDELAAVSGAHPTISELAFLTAQSATPSGIN